MKRAGVDRAPVHHLVQQIRPGHTVGGAPRHAAGDLEAYGRCRAVADWSKVTCSVCLGEGREWAHDTG